MFGSYSVVFWNHSGIEVAGSCHFQPFRLSINDTKIKWRPNGTMPTSFCTPECEEGHKKKQEGAHKCCFNCTICQGGTYINITENPYECKKCNETEWSPEGSTSCKLRPVVYLPFTQSLPIAIMFGTLVLVGMAIAVSVLFAVNYNTPVVRSAGGPMCFLILGCLILSSLSVFFYFGKPTGASCVFRFVPFLLFFNICQACFVVRSFQIVTIFKVAAKFPDLIRGWRRYHGQWLFISVAFVTQAIILIIGNEYESSTLENKMSDNKIILGCKIHHETTICFAILPLSFIILGFIFSYMGKSLPKNYSEAKAITFCFFLLLFIWIIFVTTYIVYKGKYIDAINALAILSSLYSFLLSYFLPKCYIIVFQPYKNTHQYFQNVIQDYTKQHS
ncbi:taste receptor type 1 member 1-like [Cololabis saira]|uniref:taste receptor type 1 member 1-like n=1 Tax=Cololabis saira TaxID=129043 RepID=UPI002AD24E78|nr:taste receptor type 1 member 1-like [Cololabis saira]